MWGLVVAALCVALNGFFVAAEFALVAVRRTRVEELVNQGKSGAAALLLATAPAFAQAPSTSHWPNQKEGDFVIKDFRFKSGETLPVLNVHYTTLGTPQRNASGAITNAVAWDKIATYDYLPN